MSDVLITHPWFGSLWLTDCEIVNDGGRKYVVGLVLDDSGVGSRHVPEDFRGTRVPMWFPVSCIRKDPDGILFKSEDGGEVSKCVSL